MPTKRHGDIGRGLTTPSAAPQHVLERYAVRNARLNACGYSSYRAYLNSDHWSQTRDRYRKSSLPQQCICGDDEVHLHHTTYERIGQERLSDLTPLCRRCHQMVHVLEWRGQIGLGLEGLELDTERAARGREFLADLIASIEVERRETLRQQQADLMTLTFARRLLLATRAAKANRRDIKRHLRTLNNQVRTGRGDAALTRQLRRIEEIAYGWEGWRDQLL